MTHTARLTASELGMLWTSYLEDTASNCLLQYFLRTVEDKEIEVIIQQAKRCCDEHIVKIDQIFKQEGIPTPQGFTDEDVHLEAPRLYSDVFKLRYLKHLSIAGMSTYSVAKGISVRQDLRELFRLLYQDTSSLHDASVNLLVAKGLSVRPPEIEYPKQVEYVQKERFLAGVFGNQRPLTAIEIAHLGINLEKNNLGKKLLTGFAQVAVSKEVAQYMERGRDISQKVINIMNQILTDDNLPNPDSSDYSITSSTVAPFSDKLMMFITSSLSAIGIGNYGLALGASFRRDIAGHYTRFLTEAGLYAEDGVELMISNGWLEQPPQNVNHDSIINN